MRVRFFSFLIAATASLSSGPAFAEPSALFAPGSIICINFDPLSNTCRTINAVTRIEGDLRYDTSRRNVAVPGEALLLETEGVARVDGLKVCGIAATAPPRITPVYSRYADAIRSVHIQKRDYRIARGDCLIYKPCGTAFHIYRLQDGVLDEKPRSIATVFEPDDPRIESLTLRERIFGVLEPLPPLCEPIG
jgi:hypothetical protein